jgi:outer membrane protein assembly factor BamB
MDVRSVSMNGVVYYIANGKLTAANLRTGKLFAFDLETGKDRWSYNTGQASGNPELRVYLISRETTSLSRITVCNLTTGRLIWSHKHDHFTDEIHLDGQLLIIGAVESGLISMRKYYAFDKARGKQQ